MMKSIKSSASYSSPLALSILGSFRIEGATGSIPLATRKIECLLSYLALHPQEQSREKIATLFWGDSTDKLARDSLRTALVNLRKALGKQVILSDRDTMQLNPALPLWVDALELQKLAASHISMMDDAVAVSSRLEQAIALYRGDLLEDFYDEWIQTERHSYRTLYLDLLAQGLDALRTFGEYTRAIQLGETLLAMDASNERTHRELMLCYFASGQRSAALRQYDECVRILRAELDVEPSRETTALYQEIRQATLATKPAQTQLTNLPFPLTSFIGRRQEIAKIRQLLSDARLVTLAGAGGSGKTRLAIQVATDLVRGDDDSFISFKDGVWWIELAALKDPALVPHAVAKVVGVREMANQSLSEILADALQAKSLLLILDNCEHLIGACAQLANQLLAACPALKVFTTSREPLALFGEQLYQVPTLTLPGTVATGAHELLEYEGTRLFIERARAVQSEFVVSERNASTIVQICDRLDGIPLAIELAAARIKVLSPEELASRLNDRFELLTLGSRTALPRQQTLRATIDWSHALLNEAEQVLFRRLAVFAGGFTLEAASAICMDADWAVGSLVDVLAHLVDKSLVIVDPPGLQARDTRFRLLETIREYAAAKLSEAEEAQIFHNRHLEFFLKTAEVSEPHMTRPDQLVWLNRLDGEHTNLGAAIEWAMQRGDIQRGLRLVGALRAYWFLSDYQSEGRKRAKEILAQPQSSARTAARAKALNAAGHLYWAVGRYEQAESLLEEGLAIAQELGEKRIEAVSLRYLGVAASGRGDYGTAQSFLEQTLSLWRELGERSDISLSLSFLGDVALAEGKSLKAQSLYQESAKLLNEFGDKHVLAYPLRRLGHIALDQGDYPKAAALFLESLELNLDIGNKMGIAACLAAFADVAATSGELVEAARLLGAVHTFTSRHVISLLPTDSNEYDRNLARVRETLDDTTFSDTWSTGLMETLDQAIELARHIARSVTVLHKGTQ